MTRLALAALAFGSALATEPHPPTAMRRAVERVRLLEVVELVAAELRPYWPAMVAEERAANIVAAWNGLSWVREDYTVHDAWGQLEVVRRTHGIGASAALLDRLASRVMAVLEAQP